jgi:hypothetical protein
MIATNWVVEPPSAGTNHNPLWSAPTSTTICCGSIDTTIQINTIHPSGQTGLNNRRPCAL